MFNARLFEGTAFRPKKVTLYTGAGDISLFRDYLVSELTRGLSFSSMRFEPRILFLNGEYWGVCHLAEKYDGDYIEYYYNVPQDNVIIIKQREVETGLDEDVVLYEEMVNFITNNDMSDAKNYEEACRLIDMESYVQYFAALLDISRYGDWPEGNFALWRARETGIGAFADGRWRWMVYDIESDALTDDVIEQDTLALAMEQDPMLVSLLHNEEFRERLADTMMEFMDTIYAPEKVIPVVDAYEMRMSDAMELHYQRFYGGVNPFAEEMEELRTFFRNRKPYVEIIAERLRETNDYNDGI